MSESKFIDDLMRCGFSKSFARAVYRALLEEDETMIESYVHTAQLLFNEKEIV